ncbi:isoaspartyl peptidase/L-asparaginase [Oxalobacteraceae bacterium OTU3REALA1]|nr:isoaspartyl peptidase/L-asparaginase [Oxalobacteraceae bacterium OTU3REALA1]
MTAAISTPKPSPQAPVVVAHGGAGAKVEDKDGCTAAVEAGLARLRDGADSAPLALAPGQACDTVGAVVRDAAGHFAVAGSTGGCAPALLGRVGDTPIIGAGFYAGPAGAVAVTGIGEHIVRHLLAHTVHGWLAGGMRLAAALERALTLFDPAIDVGLIAVSATDSGARSNRDMPWAAACDDQQP